MRALWLEIKIIDAQKKAIMTQTAPTNNIKIIMNTYLRYGSVCFIRKVMWFSKNIAGGDVCIMTEQIETNLRIFNLVFLYWCSCRRTWCRAEMNIIVIKINKIIVLWISERERSTFEISSKNMPFYSEYTARMYVLIRFLLWSAFKRALLF